MLLTLLNIVLPVIAMAGIGYLFGRKQSQRPEMGFINRANVMIFCPALVLSVLIEYPVNLIESWPLATAGVLIIVIPGLVLGLLSPLTRLPGAALAVPGMFRNTGNVGIPLMMLAYGKSQLGAIIVLFVLSNVLQFSLGLILLSRQSNRWQWLRNPNVWAAVLGLLLAPYRHYLPDFIRTTAELAGQVAIPLMLFSLGVHLSRERIMRIGLALRINLLYLLVGALTVPLVLWLLPLGTEWARLIVLSAMLPPAVLNYLLCEQYQVEPKTVASVVLLGNLLSVITIPIVVWATLRWIV